jgi:hypothetical protein
MKIYLASIAAVLAVVGNIPYLIDILRGRVRPHPYTWMIWTIVSGTIFFGQLARGAGVGALPTAASEIFTLIIFLFSLRYGFKEIRSTDTYFLLAALIGLIPWLLTRDPTLSVIIMVSIDLVAFVPTIRKTQRDPTSETYVLYGTNALRHGLALGALQAYNTATMLHSLVMILVNAYMAWIIIRGKNLIPKNKV